MNDTDARLQKSRWRLDVLMTGVGVLLLAAVLVGSVVLARGPAEMLTRNTVRLSLAWYAAALFLLVRLRPEDWRAEAGMGRLVRWCWTWAAVCIVVHFVMAFSFYHHWSHRHAYDVTRATSGVGEGIYTLYLFIALWVGDAIWWWTSRASYAMRPVWIDRLLHSFMLFIAFNGMVVFERGPIRWAGIAMYLVLPTVWVMHRGWPWGRGVAAEQGEGL